jgi:hypothetical protein
VGQLGDGLHRPHLLSVRNGKTDDARRVE